MANEQVLVFIEQIKDGAIQTQKEYGIFASVTIAQAILESTYGTSYLATTDNNLFGIKFPGNHDASIIISQGSWATDDGGYYCHYESWSDSLKDHGFFLKNNSRYTESGTFEATTPQEQIRCIAKGGYASDEDYANKIISEIEYYNLTQYDNSITSAEQVENAVQWSINIAKDETHGYDQENRWGVDYDCSSLVISAYEQAGILLKTNGATYTGNLKEVALKTGFHIVEWNNDMNNLVRGDIILNEVHHVCMYIGNGKIVQASINELGTTTGGQTGDQTGNEISIKDFYVYSSGWDYVLRYKEGSIVIPPKPSEEVWKDIVKSGYNINSLSEEQKVLLKSLSYGDEISIKRSPLKNKSFYGRNCIGNHLKILHKSYIINSVDFKGFLNVGKGITLYVNPLFVKEVT